MYSFTVIEASFLLRMLHTPLPSWNIFFNILAEQRRTVSRSSTFLCRNFCPQKFEDRDLLGLPFLNIFYCISMTCEFQNKLLLS